MITINVAKDFSEVLGTEYRKYSKFSGEQFREELLEPKFLEAREKGERLVIDFGDTYGV